MLTIVTFAFATIWLVGLVAILPRTIREIRKTHEFLSKR